MVSFYVGHRQSNGEYAYVSGIMPTGVSITTKIDSAIGFEDKKIADDLTAVANSFLNGNDEEYKTISIEIEIKEL